jgi:hypothetical protein
MVDVVASKSLEHEGVYLNLDFVVISMIRESLEFV